MSNGQLNLFGTPVRAAPPPVSDELAQLIRERLQATLAMVKAAEVMPWPDRISIIHAENAFRFDKDALPAAEGAALWAEFDRELDRLFDLTAAAEEAAMQANGSVEPPA